MRENGDDYVNVLSNPFGVRNEIKMRFWIRIWSKIHPNWTKLNQNLNKCGQNGHKYRHKKTQNAEMEAKCAKNRQKWIKEVTFRTQL